MGKEKSRSGSSVASNTAATCAVSFLRGRPCMGARCVCDLLHTFKPPGSHGGPVTGKRLEEVRSGVALL